ncbi:stage VI sporulation protein D [Geomicrobium halophilum]|uniref:Stage VI sporulation protein D n=1 Tax=Geomicrobium halophilum TaxID=549000 RepID=A0A841PZT2_9BACL|nr:stage VI sporulation protein D [Geomicrobium halophilum]
MTQEQPTSLTFNLEESVWLDQGERIQTILGLELEPDITMREDDHEVVIRGGLHLIGQYHPYDKNEDELNDEYQQKFTSQKADSVRTIDTGEREIKHFFPVDVTIPISRIQSLDELYVQIDSFDYDLPEPSCIQLTADVTISGMKETEEMGAAEKTVGPPPMPFPTFTHEVKVPPPEKETSSSDLPGMHTKDRMENKQESPPQEEEEKVPEMNVEPRPEARAEIEQKPTGPNPDLEQQSETRAKPESEQEQPETALKSEPEQQPETRAEPEFEQEKTEMESEPEPEHNLELETEPEQKSEPEPEVVRIGVEKEARSETRITDPLTGDQEEEYQVVQADGDNEVDVRDEGEEVYDEEVPELESATNKKDNALYLTEMLEKGDRESFTKMRMCIIQENESLDTIADRYGYSVQQLLRWNNMDMNHVEEGEIVYIPVHKANE